MIPHVLHRVWLDDPMPEEFAGYGQRWRELHPGWVTREWRDSVSLTWLRNQEIFDRAREICPRDWKRFQADLLRLELLWLFGGVYVDCDVQPLRALDGGDLLRRGVIVAWSPNRGSGGQRLLTQAVLGAAPRHPFIDACILEVPAAARDYAGRPLAEMVGPHMITRVWLHDHCGVVPLAERAFYPQSIRQRDRGMIPDLDGAYAWHRWANTRDRRHGGVPR